MTGTKPTENVEFDNTGESNIAPFSNADHYCQMDNRTILQIYPRTRRLLVYEMIDTEKSVFRPRELKNYPDKLAFV